MSENTKLRLIAGLTLLVALTAGARFVASVEHRCGDPYLIGFQTGGDGRVKPLIDKTLACHD